MLGDDLGETIGYSMSTTADLTDTSAIIDGEAFMQNQEHFEASEDSPPIKEDEQFKFAEEKSAENSMDNGAAMEFETAEETNTKRKLQDSVSEAKDDSEDPNVSADAGPTPAKKPLLEINVRKLLPDLEVSKLKIQSESDKVINSLYLFFRNTGNPLKMIQMILLHGLICFNMSTKRYIL